jgi:hypothetical protein
MKQFFLLMLFLLSVGCATEKKDDPGSAFATKVFEMFKDFHKGFADKEGQAGAIRKMQLPEAYQTAVFFMPPDAKSKTRQNWKWDREDKNLILSALRSGKAKKVFELINTGVKSPEIDQLRAMAKMQGADTLTLIHGEAELESPLNTSALSYLVILPMFFVEGNNVKSHFTAQALMWDLRSPYVHLGAESQGEWEMKRPLIFRQTKRAIEKSKSESVMQLADKIKAEIKML